MGKFLLSLASLAAWMLPMPLKRLIYRTGPLARLIRRSLNRAAPMGLNETAIAAGPLAGMRMLLDLQEEKDYWLGVYEPELIEAATSVVPEGAVIYDVGANIGYISLALAGIAGSKGRVFAFEALPENQRRLKENLCLNRKEAQITLVPAAVIDAPRKVRFMIAPSCGMGKVEGSAGRQEVAYQDAVEIDGISLDDFHFSGGNPAPQVVKMDIEGGEVLAVPGMRRILAEGRPVILMELHGPEAAEAAWDGLIQAGYSIHRLQAHFPPLHSLEEVDWKAYIAAFPPGYGQEEQVVL